MHICNKQKFLELQVDSNQREVGVKYVEKYAEVLCGRPLNICAKGSFYSESTIRFSDIQISKKTISKNYPELEI